MSKEALALLESHAQGAEPQSNRERAEAAEMLGRVAAGESADAVVPVQRRPTRTQIMNDRMIGDDMSPAAGEVLTSIATGIPATIAGGLRGLWHLLPPNASVDRAADAVAKTQERFTYQPRDPAAQQMMGQLGEIGAYLGEREGRFIGETAQDLGASPFASTALDVGTQGLFAALTGGAGLAARRGLANLPERTPAAPAAAGGDFARQSMGAAAADVDLTRLTPELRVAFEQARKSGAPINPQAAQRLVDADTLPIPMRLTEGQATGDPSKIAAEVNRRGLSAERGKFYQEQNQQLIENLDEIRRTNGPTVVHRDHIQNGQALIDSYKDYDARIVADIDAKYQALRDAAGGDWPVDAPSLYQNINEALKKQLLSREAPQSQLAEIAELAESGGMTFEQFLSLRRNLGTISRTAADGNTRQAASIMVNELEKLPLKGPAADLKPLADDARSAARARFKALEQDPAYRAAVEDGVGIGESSPAADTFVRKFVIGGRAANLEKMTQKFADNPEVGQTLTMSALNYLRSKALPSSGESANFSQTGYNNALRDLEPRMKYLMPEQTAELTQQLGRVANTVLHQPRGAAISTSGTTAAQIAEKAAKGAEAVVNMKTGLPLGSYVRGKIDASRNQKEWLEATKPGAGLQMRDIMSGKYEAQ